MSEMSGQAQPFRTPEHDQHHPLLVAQLAAGDPLDPAEAEEARAWLTTCPECNALAADLRRVSAAVAAEPVPARRRDFRLTPEQAEAARGNPWTRFLRGLSLPRSRAFAPAAAGIMSVGLVFVVAGYAWPEDGAVSVTSETNVASAPLEEPLASTPVLSARPAPEAPAAADDAGLDEFAIEAADPDEVVTDFAPDPEFFDELAEHQAGMSVPDERQKSLEAAAVEEEAGDLAARDTEATEAYIGAVTQDDSDVVDRVSEPGTEALRMAQEAADVVQAVDGEGSAESSLTTSSIDDDSDLARWLMLVGAALAVGGGLLLLLGWLARRSRDPALR
mgnify:CR=1 FL=1